MDKIMTVYHGSRQIVEKPTFGKGKRTMISDSVFTARRMKTLQRNGRFHRFITALQTDIRWIPNT